MKKKQQETQQERPYFYAPDIAEIPYLNEDESHHLARVLRLVAGDEVIVTNGRGEAWQAVVEVSNPKRSKLSLTTPLAVSKKEFLSTLHIAIAPTKNIARIEWLLEKSVEIGVQKFSLIQTEKTLRQKLPIERIERLMIAAMKQSQKWQTTEIKSYESLKTFLQEEQGKGEKHQHFIAYCGADKEKVELSRQLQPNRDTTIMIGPEGDFTQEEVEMAKKSGFHVVSLGEERLRTETAGLYATMTYHIINQLEQK